MQDGAPSLFFALVLALSWSSPFRRFWQLFIVVGALVAGALSFSKMASFIASMHLAPAVAATAFPADSLFCRQQIRTLMICSALMRLQFRWVVGLQIGLLGVGITAFVSKLLLSTPTANDISRFLQTTVAVMVAVMLAGWVAEPLSR